MNTNNSKFLYEVFEKAAGGFDHCVGHVIADSDVEAIQSAVTAFGKYRALSYVRRDHWGKGPMIPVLKSVKAV